jgi:hypothetical protein
MLSSIFHKNYPSSTGPNLLAGSASGTSGYSNATGPAARFNTPRGMARDGLANTYICDQSNHAIRKMTPSGVVTTFAGTGSSGFTNGNGTSASFNNPVSIAIDVNSNLYVADMSNNAIRKIDSNANVTTMAFAVNGPMAISVDSSGSNAITIDSNYYINVYRDGIDYGALSMTNNVFSKAFSVAVRNDGVFYYGPAPGSMQSPTQTNVPNAFRITFGTPAVSPTITNVSRRSNGGTSYDITFTTSYWLGGPAYPTSMNVLISGFSSGGSPDFGVYNGLTVSIQDSNNARINWKFTADFGSAPAIGTPSGTPIMTALTFSNTFTGITVNTQNYGNTFNGLFFYSPTKLYITKTMTCNIFSEGTVTEMTLSGDDATSNSGTASGLGPFFIVKSPDGPEYFASYTTSNQIVSYSNVY